MGLRDFDSGEAAGRPVDLGHEHGGVRAAREGPEPARVGAGLASLEILSINYLQTETAK